MCPRAVLLPAQILSVTGGQRVVFWEGGGRGGKFSCVFFFSCFLSSQPTGLTRCHAGWRQICQHSQTVLLMFGALER